MKELGASQVVLGSVVFALRMVDIIREFMDDIPDAMRQEIAEVIDIYMGSVGEFVDMDAVYRAFGETTDESTA